jgi:hypothetical protein
LFVRPRLGAEGDLSQRARQRRNDAPLLGLHADLTDCDTPGSRLAPPERCSTYIAKAEA